jgi:hypothetical protein
MAWKRSAMEASASILKRVRAESSRNKKLTKLATQSVIQHLVQDTAESLSLHGQARIPGLGRFKVSALTGEVRFFPYSKFLDDVGLANSKFLEECALISGEHGSKYNIGDDDSDDDDNDDDEY